MALTRNFSYYKLTERKLKVIPQKKYALRFFIRPLDFSLETRQDSIHLDESVNPRNDLKFSLVKVIVRKIACQSR